MLHAESFGVRAYDAVGEELLWVVSSIEVAGFAGEGRAVEWLANSVFQDNTPAYRRSQADRIIGQIETGLRELLDHHGLQRVGAAYPDQLWSPSELSTLKGRADAEGRTSEDARTLLDYAFLALRISGGSEGVEQRPVGSAGIQQGSDPVVGEVGEPERGAFDPLHQVAASVAALVTRAACQLEIWVRQRQMVRPSRLISGGMAGSWRSVASWATVAAPTLASSMS